LPYTVRQGALEGVEPAPRRPKSIVPVTAYDSEKRLAMIASGATSSRVPATTVGYYRALVNARDLERSSGLISTTTYLRTSSLGAQTPRHGETMAQATYQRCR
jgi:hypothetical protein